MGTTHPWWFVSGFAFLVGILWLLVSGYVGFQLLRQALPLLTETKDQIEDLGNIASHTVGSVSETLDLIENRVTLSLGEAVDAGTSVSQRSLGVGSAVAGVYLASRIARLLKKSGPARVKSRRRRRIKA